MGEESEAPTNYFKVIPNSNVTSGGGSIKLGDNYLWVDATGDLRISVSGQTTSDTGGTVIGTQS